MTCGNTSGIIGLSNFNKHDQLFKRGISEVYFAFEEVTFMAYRPF
jgi:hypothetical protein